MSERTNIAELRREAAGGADTTTNWAFLPVTITARDLFELVEAVVRAKSELELLNRWAGEQDAGNAFAQQVRYWALSHLDRRLLARFDFGGDA